jgi:phenylacetate-CoA ligase
MTDHTFNHNLEFASSDKIKIVQDRLLVAHIRFLADTSGFYQKQFTHMGIDVASITGLQDLKRLPLTNKRDLEQHSKDFLCVSHEEIVDICLTSGTTGRPTALMQTKSDLERLGYNEELSFLSTGITPKDKVMIAAAIDRCFMAGMAYFLGLLRIGVTIIRAGSSSMPVLTDLVLEQKPTAIVGVPTLMLAIGRRLAEDGADPRALSVKRLICIGEPVREQDFSLSSLGRKLEELWGAQIFGTYASTEMATTFCECSEHRGGHAHPDLILVEVLDDNGQPVQPGTPGDVVVTPLGVRGMPLLRFRTGDVAVLHDQPCKCGRNSPRLGSIMGRKSQLLKIRGTTVFPAAIFSALQEIPGVVNFYIEVRGQYALSDEVKVVAGVRDPGLTPFMLSEQISAKTRIKPEVVLADPDTVQDRTLVQGKRKPVQFFDYRDKLDE